MSDLEVYVDWLRDRGVERVDELAERAAEAGLDKATAWLDGAGRELLSADLADAAREGVEGLRAAAPHLGTLSRTQASGILSHVFRGGATDRASLELAAAALAFDERLKAQRAGSLAKLREELAEQHAWDEIAATLKAVGLDALKAAIPLLLAAL
ncbi:MAG: hypothetical protein KDD82_19415 [Planctomycetes bacterium]|nr:hypothetical protein [Planctomycetota bacterium]